MRYGDVFEVSQKYVRRVWDRVSDAAYDTAEKLALARLRHPELDHAGSYAHPDVEAAERRDNAMVRKAVRAGVILNAARDGENGNQRGKRHWLGRALEFKKRELEVNEASSERLFDAWKAADDELQRAKTNYYVAKRNHPELDHEGNYAHPDVELANLKWEMAAHQLDRASSLYNASRDREMGLSGWEKMRDAADHGRIYRHLKNRVSPK